MPVEFHSGENSGDLTFSAEVEELVIERKISKAGSALSSRAEGKQPNLIHQQSKQVNVKQLLQESNATAANTEGLAVKQRIGIAESLSSKAETFMRDDGYYSEGIRVKARLKGADAEGAELELQNWNYYRVKNGKAWRISSAAYSAATDKTSAIEKNGKLEKFHQGEAGGINSGHQLEGASKKSYATRVHEPEREAESSQANQDRSESHEQ